jgi:hypothetical protein
MHGFDVVAVRQQVGAGHGFRRGEFAVGEQGCRRDDLGRQPIQGGDVAGGHLGVVLLAGHPKQRV